MKILNEEVAMQVLESTVNGARHPYYKRVTELSELYLRLMTGEDIEPLLIQFNPREDSEMFEQRKRITKTIVGAVSGKVKGPFEKVARSNNVTKKLILSEESEGKEDDLNDVLDVYWGDETLDDYMEQRVLDLSFNDPNSFIVTESIKVDGDVKVFPFEVGSVEAVNYHYTNNSLDFLIVHDGEKKWTMYTVDFSVVLIEKKDTSNEDQKKTVVQGELIDSIEASGSEEGQTKIEIGAKTFSIWKVENPCDEIPAIRVGYKRDEMTHGNTYVSPMQKGIPRLQKIIKSDSELDLVVALHAFPQKLQYSQRCQGNQHKQEICDTGIIRNGENKGEKCGKCSGTGFLFHTSAQSALIYELPPPDELNAGAQPVDLEKMIAYKAPSVDILKFENEYTRQLEDGVIKDVFISQNFERSNGSATATEINFDLESIYDTLYPFARKYSSIYKKQVRLTACYVGTDKGLKVIHQFPKDFKLKTISQLLEELEKAEKANAPEFFKKQLNSDIARKIWHDDPAALSKFEAKQQHMPFAGKTQQQIMDIIAAGRSTKEATMLWVEFENIMQSIEDEQFNLPEPKVFYNLPYDDRKALIDAKLAELMLAKTAELGIGALNVEGGLVTDDALDIEAESKAKLRGTVGGIQGILAINLSVANGEMTEEAAEEMLVQLFGFDIETAKNLIQPVDKSKLPTLPPPIVE